MNNPLIRDQMPHFIQYYLIFHDLLSLGLLQGIVANFYLLIDSTTLNDSDWIGPCGTRVILNWEPTYQSYICIIYIFLLYP